MKKVNFRVLLRLNYRNQIVYTLVIASLLFIGNIFFFQKMLQHVGEKNLSNFLMEVEDELEERIETNLQNYLYTNLHKYSRLSEYSLFYQDNDHSKDFFLKLRLSMVDSIRNYPYIEDITLYRIDDNSVISAKKSGNTFDGLTSNFDDIKPFASKDGLDAPFLFKNASNQLMYIYPVIQSNRHVDGSYRGFASLYLSNPNNFFHSNMKQYSSNGTLLLLDPSSILYTEGSNTLSDEVIFQILHNSSSEEITKSTIQSLDYIFYYLKSKNYDFNYLYYQPNTGFLQSLTNNPEYLYLFIFSNSIIFIFGMCIFLFIGSATKKGKQYLLLKENYEDILIKSRQSSNIQLVMERYLSVNKNSPNFAIFVVEPNILSMGDISEKQKHILYEEIKEIAKNFFEASGHSYVVSLKSKEYLSCIINYDTIKDMEQYVSDFSSEIKRYNNYSFNIFYAYNYQSVVSATDAYLKLVPLLKYSYLYNYNQTFTLPLLEEFEENNKIIEPKMVETIQVYLTEFKCKNLMDYLYSTLQLIYDGKYSYDKAMDFYSTFLMLLRNFCVEKSIDYKLSTMPLFTQLQSFHTLTDCLSFIDSFLTSYSASLTSLYSNTNRKYIESILHYIDEHTEEVTLSLASQEFHITSSHLSRVFKEHMGINFSDYVSEKKLLKAAKLLKDNQNMNITDVASRFGYNTPSYFSSKFKERFGVTPAAYRKEIINIK